MGPDSPCTTLCITKDSDELIGISKAQFSNSSTVTAERMDQFSQVATRLFVPCSVRPEKVHIGKEVNNQLINPLQCKNSALRLREVKQLGEITQLQSQSRSHLVLQFYYQKCTLFFISILFIF